MNTIELLKNLNYIKREQQSSRGDWVGKRVCQIQVGATWVYSFKTLCANRSKVETLPYTLYLVVMFPVRVNENLQSKSSLNQLCETFPFSKQEQLLIFSSLKKSCFSKLLVNSIFQWFLGVSIL